MPRESVSRGKGGVSVCVCASESAVAASSIVNLFVLFFCTPAHRIESNRTASPPIAHCALHWRAPIRTTHYLDKFFFIILQYSRLAIYQGQTRAPNAASNQRHFRTPPLPLVVSRVSALFSYSTPSNPPVQMPPGLSTMAKKANGETRCFFVI
ncbi:hypothetical protein LX32DRAFT_207692 [Colletotrichum zoysiae]|uniref:Uncharacterized protein n=1 Tax=Colletotrichum zoysiae TaxID=1216348 RepID=A0AAD9HNT4_9PEZI|nr:hypothetical protein LX32DRAFT_207692 [Colletotrichum zoysiae]